MPYLISAVSIRDFKRIHEIEITPAADSVLILLGGENFQGKTSVFEAMEAALEGARSIIADAVRHGAELADVCVGLTSTEDGHTLTSRRRIEPDGTTILELRDDTGVLDSPQARLNKLIGARFLDPLRWLRLDAAEQRKRLLDLVDREGKIAALDAKRARLFSRRTEIGRDVKRTAAALASAGPAIVAPAPIDVVALSQEIRQLDESARQASNAIERVDRADRRCMAALSALAVAQEALARAQSEVEAATAEQHAAVAARALTVDTRAAAPRIGQLQAEIARANTHNNAVAAGRAAEQSRRKLAAEHAAAEADHAKHGADIEVIDEQKRAHLATTQLPIEGLGISDAGVTYRGALLENASGAERMRVAVTLAIAAQPQIRDVWIRDGAVLSVKSMAEIEQLARDVGVRIWIERVETRDPGVIEIREGRLVSASFDASGGGSGGGTVGDGSGGCAGPQGSLW